MNHASGAHLRRRRRRAIGAVAVIAGVVALAGCGVQPDSAPRELPLDERDLIVGNESANVDASGADRIYLIGPGEDRLLRSVRRAASSAEDLVNLLLLGPNDAETQDQFTSAIPSTTRLIDSHTNGQIFTVDLTSDILDLDTQNLTRAVAQIVYTATELDGIESVRIEVDHEPLSAPTPGGDTTTGQLRIYDFPGLLQTSQPAYPAAPVNAGTS